MTSLEIGQLKLIKQDIEAILSHEGDDVGEFDPGECLYQIFKKANNAKQIISSLSEPTIEPSKEVSAEEVLVKNLSKEFGPDEWKLSDFFTDKEIKGILAAMREYASLVREQAQKEGDGVVASVRQDSSDIGDAPFKDNNSIEQENTFQYDDLSGLAHEEKMDIIKGPLGDVAKQFLIVFIALGLKTHIEQMIIEENSGEQFILSFRPLKEHLKSSECSLNQSKNLEPSVATTDAQSDADDNQKNN